jgi:hypothetical protein
MNLWICLGACAIATAGRAFHACCACVSCYCAFAPCGAFDRSARGFRCAIGAALGRDCGFCYGYRDDRHVFRGSDRGLGSCFDLPHLLFCLWNLHHHVYDVSVRSDPRGAFRGPDCGRGCARVSRVPRRVAPFQHLSEWQRYRPRQQIDETSRMVGAAAAAVQRHTKGLVEQAGKRKGFT